MLDSKYNNASLTEVSPSRRGVRSGSDGYPRAAVLLQSHQPSYNLFNDDNFNYQEPSPGRKLSYNGSGRQQQQLYSPTSNNFDQFPYYQPNSQALARSPWNGSLWNPETQGNSVIRSFFILTNATIGAGVVCQAYSAHNSGWGLYLIFHLIVALTADWTHGLMTDLAEATGVSSYEDLVFGLYGNIGTCLISATVLVQNVGSMIVYVVLFVQSAPHVSHWIFGGNVTSQFYNPNLLSTKAMFVAAAVVLLILPFSFFKRVGKLGIISCISTFGVLFMTSATVNSYYTHSTCPHTLPHIQQYQQQHASINTSNISSTFFTSNTLSSLFTSSPSSSSFMKCNQKMTLPTFNMSSSTFISLPMIVYAYMSHATLLPIHYEMSGIKRTGLKKAKTMLSIRLTMLCTVIVYSVFGIFGGMIYTKDEISSNIMYNFQIDMKSSDFMLHFALLCWIIMIGLSVSCILHLFISRYCMKVQVI